VKLGHAYEFAQQHGKIKVDMVLSKWFLCSAAGGFEKDEVLAFMFAEKAAGKGLLSAEFALGYYAEVGVGGWKDIELAGKWYTRVSSFLRQRFLR
jgi:TPR repeat protein